MGFLSNPLYGYVKNNFIPYLAQYDWICEHDQPSQMNNIVNLTIDPSIKNVSYYFVDHYSSFGGCKNKQVTYD